MSVLRSRWVKIPLGILLFLLLFVYGYFLYPVWDWPMLRHHKGSVPITPAWALECWLWEDDNGNADFVRELLKGYRDNDFPVRTVLIDSAWDTRYNDYIVDEKLYPEPKKFFTELQDQGYRVVLWTTCLVNSMSRDTAIQNSQDWFDEAKNKGYLAAGGHQTRWWKGKGGFIDYTNPEAMKWWHGLQQNVFDWGLDGWKLDGTAEFYHSFIGPVPVPYGRAHGGWLTNRDYISHYYRDEYLHGLTQNPEFITLARSIDNGEIPGIQPWGCAPLEAAPVCWVGDNEHTWDDEGIQEALRDIFLSAKKGYCVVGSDVGGYHGKEPIPPNVYIRWAQFSAFCGLFLNGGHGERRMWMRTPEELDIIRKFSWLHTELVPYMYSHVVACHNGAPPLIRPLEEGKWEYLFGDDFLVAPIYQDSLTREVALPKGRWRYLFKDDEVIEGPKTFTRDFPLDEAPVYVRDGAIVPMKVERAYTGIGDKDWAEMLTLNCYPHGQSKFTVHPTDKSAPIMVSVNESKGIDVSLEGGKKPHIVRVRVEKEPQQVTRDGVPLERNAGYTYQALTKRVVIRSPDGAGGKYHIE